VLDADLSKSTKSDLFKNNFPERFINVGIAEANMIGIAAGLEQTGKIPFASSFACFVTSRTYDQLRVSIAYSNRNVKIVGSHMGISVGEDGPTHHAIEDIALTCALPNFTVLVPADEFATRVLVKEAANTKGPFYIRLSRPKARIVYNEKTNFKIGKANILCEGKDVTIITCGLQVAESLIAIENLKSKGISCTLIDMHTIKPLDTETIISHAKKTNCVVTIEEHLLDGGLGSRVSMTLAKNYPTPMECLGLTGYTESGKPDELLNKYGLSNTSIEAAIIKILQKKKT
jgi:transketolase